MFHRRVKRKPERSTFYLITNRVTGGSLIFGDREKEKIRTLLFDGEKRFGYRVWDYVILGNHYHALLEVSRAEDMARDEVLRRWGETVRLKNPKDPGDDVLAEHRAKIHDISLIVGNFQQRFTQWYNARNNRWGKLFGARFDSVLLDEQGAIARSMAYITLNAVRAELVAEPAEYRWCGYAERMAKGKLRDDDVEIAPYMARELGLPPRALQGDPKQVLDRLWRRFRESLLGHPVSREVDRRTVADVLNKENKPLELEWPQRLMLKTRFATQGVAIGSRSFVEDVLRDFQEELGYKREHRAEEARAWDGVYCLRKHRRWVS